MSATESPTGLLGLLARLVGRKLAAYVLVGVLGIAFFGLLYAGVWVFSLVETRVDVLDATGAPIEVSIDGEPARTIEPGDWILFQPFPGEHTFVASGPNGVIEERTLSVGVGSNQVWTVGEARFAVVRCERTPDGRDVPDLAGAREYRAPGPVFELPDEVTLERLDVNFRIGFGADAIGDESVRLCTLIDGGTRLGCEMCQRWDDCEPALLPMTL
ncbi:MAG: hypothetical protein KC619_19540 [Myxococcales bacterium]|nr:hypothetical protein [Myxococcales bacterium]